MRIPKMNKCESDGSQCNASYGRLVKQIHKKTDSSVENKVIYRSGEKLGLQK